MLQKKHKKTYSRLAANSWSCTQNINWRLRIFIIKTNSLFNLISHQPAIDKIYLYVLDPHKAKYQLLINKRESTGLKHLNDSKAFF